MRAKQTLVHTILVAAVWTLGSSRLESPIERVGTRLDLHGRSEAYRLRDIPRVDYTKVGWWHHSEPLDGAATNADTPDNRAPQRMEQAIQALLESQRQMMQVVAGRQGVPRGPDAKIKPYEEGEDIFLRTFERTMVMQDIPEHEWMRQ